MNFHPISAIIPAAGNPTNRIMVNSNLPDTMLPINGKPVISYIIEDLIQRSIKNITIVLSQTDNHTEKYVQKKFSGKLDFLKFYYNSSPERGVGYSIYLASRANKNPGPVLIYLGDTIYKEKQTFKNNFLIVSKNFKEQSKWCLVEDHQSGLSFIDKPKKYTGRGKALCGIYFFKNGPAFKQSVQKANRKKRTEIKEILEKYQEKEKFKLIETKQGWYDCGNIENYYKARVDFLKVREFNSIEYNDFFGYITKRGRNRQKLIQEINWYLNMPQELKIFAPRLLDYTITARSASYKTEFYGYQTLADIFVFGYQNLQTWKIIINRLFEVMDLFKKYKSQLPYQYYREMYYRKTIDRITRLEKEPFWKHLLNREKIIINGEEFSNIKAFLHKIEKATYKMNDKKEMCFIHGDLCLSNILFDLNSRVFKFIDPRGSFGQMSVYGDLKYDLAKLRHSFSGFYDFISSDLFKIEQKGNKFEFQIYNEPSNQEIAKYFDQTLTAKGYSLEKIKFIEALLFLSMIPLHSDNQERQIAMYLTGLQLINQLKL